MSKPRKKYRPKYTYAQQLQSGQDAIFTRSKEEVEPGTTRTISLALIEAMDAMKTGEAQAEHFNLLSTAANLAAVLCESGVGAEYIDVCKRALHELKMTRERYYKTGRFLFTGEAIRYVTEVIDVREAQLLAEGYTAGMEYCAAKMVQERLVKQDAQA